MIFPFRCLNQAGLGNASASASHLRERTALIFQSLSRNFSYFFASLKERIWHYSLGYASNSLGDRR